jgi:uncharacterized OB-fold protein
MIDWGNGLPMMIGPYEVGLTETSPETVEFWAGVGRGELLVKHCSSCGAYLHPRRILCPECRSDQLAWEVSSGRGTVYSFSTIYHPPNELFVGPYTNGIIELAEGPYLFGRILSDEIADIHVGAGVTVEFAPVIDGGDVLPQYRLS